MKYQSYTPEMTQKIAATFARDLKVGDIICLYGDLGVGKTAFVQGLAQGLCVKDYVTSPTFTIVNEYMGSIPLYHFDVYRIDDEDELYEIGFEEYLNGNGICVIEWSEKIVDFLPMQRYDVKISKNDTKDENYRSIEIDKRG